MKWIHYKNLVAKGVVSSRMTLKRLIDSQDFPPGVLITPNARAWNEDEVDAWIAARPAARKPSNSQAHLAFFNAGCSNNGLDGAEREGVAPVIDILVNEERRRRHHP